MKILITGTPGSGKTTIVKYAHSQNDKRFFDMDEIIGLCEWRDFETAKLLGLVTDYKATGGDAWYVKYGWYWNENFLVEFLNKNPDAVLCGSSENIVECYKYFDNIFILKKTEDELLANLQSPERTNPFGKTPEQRKNFLNWQDYLTKGAEKHPHTIVEGNDIGAAYNLITEGIR